MLCALLCACGACSAEVVPSGTNQPLVTASAVELEVTTDDGQLQAKAERLIFVNEDDRMRLEGGASVTLQRTHEHSEVGRLLPIFIARAKQIEIDRRGPIIELKGAVHARFLGDVHSDADAGF